MLRIIFTSPSTSQPCHKRGSFLRISFVYVEDVNREKMNIWGRIKQWNGRSIIYLWMHFKKKFDFQHHREWVCRVENLGLTSNALHDCLLLIIMKMNENIFRLFYLPIVPKKFFYAWHTQRTCILKKTKEFVCCLHSPWATAAASISFFLNVCACVYSGVRLLQQAT